MLIWLKSWFPLPSSAPEGGGRGAEEEAGAEIPRLQLALSRLAFPPLLERPDTITHTHTPKPQPFSPGPLAPTSRLGSLETVVEARGARRGSQGSLSRGR